jgi:ATP-dependent exoDNAse (exonuclease V) alpha subunit
LCSALRRELGLECIRGGRNADVAGVPKAVLDRFAKRRKMIERAAAEHGFDTSANREAAQIVSYQTRSAKRELPPLAELETRWSVELASEGWSAEQLWRAVNVEADQIHRQSPQKIDRTTSRISACAAVVDRLVVDQSVFERRTLLRHVAEALQTECTADEILAAVQDLERRGNIVRVGLENNEPVYSTETMIATERDMLRSALERRNEREFVSSEIVERIIAHRPGLREEQRAAVRHALNRDGISIIEGSAGVGKSFSMEAIAAAARDAGAGLEFWTIAPSWKAVEVARAATGTAAEMARAVRGFILRMQRGEIKLSRSSIVCLDEGSMVGLTDLAALTHLCAAASAKLVIGTDSSQLQPLTAGLPVAALARVLGSSRMSEIQRQKDANHRAASMDFATGNPVRALESYDRAGAIIWAHDREETIARLAQDYINDQNRSDLNQKEHRGTRRSRAVLATWNADVHELNRCIRARLRQAGGLAGEDFSITAVPRGGGKPGTLALAAGDEVIFGESVKVGGHNIRNADIGKVQRIGGDPANLLITIRFDNGVEVTARVSELVGYRQKDEPHYPRIQHAYALTVYAAQGVTVDDCYVANLRGMSREATYVSMTRHRDRVRLYVDQSRVRDALSARAPARVMTTRSSIELPEEDDIRGEPSEVSIKTTIMEESRRSDRKVNVSDFIDDIEAWVNAEPGCGAGAGSATPHRGKATAVREALLSQPVVQSSPISSGPVQHSSTGANRIARRMLARATSPARYASSRSAIGSRRSTGKTMREEMNRLLSTTPPGSPPLHSDGQYCDIWNTEIRVASGRRMQTAIFRIADRISEIHVRVREWWRQKFGTWMRTATSQGPVGVLVRLASPGPVAVSVRRRWHAMKVASAEQPVSLPGVRPKMLAFCQANICIDAAPESSGERDFITLARRNETGELVGLNSYESGSGQSRSELIGSEGEGGLFQAGNICAPDRIYVTDHGIDTLLLCPPDEPLERSLFIATDGVPKISAVATIACLARRHRNAIWCLDLGDGAREALPGYAVRHAIGTENPSAKIEVGAARRLQERGPGGDMRATSTAIGNAEHEEYRPAPKRNPRLRMVYRGPRL